MRKSEESREKKGRESEEEEGEESEEEEEVYYDGSYDSLLEPLKILSGQELTKEQVATFYAEVHSLREEECDEDELWQNFWQIIFKELDGLSPFEYFFERLDVSAYSITTEPPELHQFGLFVSQEGMHKYFHHYFFSIVPNDIMLEELEVILSIYNSSANHQLVEFQRAKAQLEFVVEACKIIVENNNVTQTLLPFSKKLLSFLLELNIEFDNKKFVQAVYREVPEFVPYELLITYGNQFQTITALEDDFFRAVDQANREMIQETLDKGVFISCTRTCGELRQSEIGTVSLKGLLDEERVNALFLCARIIDKNELEKTWGMLIANGIEVEVPAQDLTGYDRLNYGPLNRFSCRITARINSLKKDTPEWIRNQLEAKTLLVPVRMQHKPVEIRDLYGFLFASQFNLSLSSKNKTTMKPVDKETFAMILPILKIVAANPNIQITLDLLHRTIGNVFKNQKLSSAGGIAIADRQIYVGAEYQKQVLGTLVHEMCHCVCTIVFRNKSLPYGKVDSDEKLEECNEILKLCTPPSDQELSSAYNTIFKLCETHYEKLPPLFNDIFIAKAYSEEYQKMAELIVRIPQFFVIHGYQKAKSKFDQFPEDLGERFIEFYSNYFVPRLEQYIKDAEKKLLDQALDIVGSISLNADETEEDRGWGAAVEVKREGCSIS
jgi:hypothetical protein